MFTELMLATPDDFTEALIETKPGQPNSKTGIYPCLYELKITNFLRNREFRQYSLIVLLLVTFVQPSAYI